MYTKTLFILLPAVLMLTAVGCGDKVPMRGKVTFSDDQSPLTVGQVTFSSNSVLARGHLKPDGTYVIGTDTEKDGLPKGTYTVSIQYAVENVMGPSVGGLPPTATQRPLIMPVMKEVVVDGKTKVYNIEVERAK